jgi:hypothetical protein
MKIQKLQKNNKQVSLNKFSSNRNPKPIISLTQNGVAIVTENNSIHIFFRFNVSTIKPIKKHKENTIRYKLHLESQQSLGISSDYSKIVKLPKDENKEEWIAVHIIDFYNILNRLFSCIGNSLFS